LLYPFLPINSNNNNTNDGGDGYGGGDDDDDDELSKIVQQLEVAIETIPPFLVRLKDFGTFGGKKRGVLWLHPDSTMSGGRSTTTTTTTTMDQNSKDEGEERIRLVQSSTSGGCHAAYQDNEEPLCTTTTTGVSSPLHHVQASLERAFPTCRDQSQKGERGVFVPHMTISHFACLEDALTAQKQLESAFPNRDELMFWLDRIYLLERKGDDGQFLRVADIAMGKRTLASTDDDHEAFPAASSDGRIITKIYNPPIPFPAMPTKEEDWVYEERMKMKERRRRNGAGRRDGGGSRRRRNRGSTGPRGPDTPEVIAAKRAERKAKRERLMQEQQQQQQQEE
jgi:2'-5' RNA ligase